MDRTKPRLISARDKPAVPEAARPFVSALASLVAQAVVRQMTGRKRLRLRYRPEPKPTDLRLVKD